MEGYLPSVIFCDEWIPRTDDMNLVDISVRWVTAHSSPNTDRIGELYKNACPLTVDWASTKEQPEWDGESNEKSPMSFF
jgi:hypothetical protein